MSIADKYESYKKELMEGTIMKMIADPAYTGTVTGSPPMTTVSIAPTGASMWMGPREPRKFTEFQVHKRVNGPTLLAKSPADLMLKIKADFVKQLVDQLMAADAIEITSVKSDKNASVTFTATLRVETKS